MVLCFVTSDVLNELEMEEADLEMKCKLYVNNKQDSVLFGCSSLDHTFPMEQFTAMFMEENRHGTNTEDKRGSKFSTVSLNTARTSLQIVEVGSLLSEVENSPRQNNNQ